MTAGDDDTLLELLAQLLRRPVEPEARRDAALHLLDWVGVVAAASMAEVVQPVVSLTRSRPAGPAPAIGAGGRDHLSAAFHNATLAIALEQESTHRASRTHPGPAVIAAAVAVAQRADASPGALLDAVVRGYEAVIRVGEAAGPGHYLLWHTTSTAGRFGAAAAAASLLALDAEATADALGLAGTDAGGFWQCRLDGSPGKLLHAGNAAELGFRAAELAALGLRAPRRLLEGEKGFFAASCPDPQPDALLRGGDGPWRILESSLKPWPGCRHTHPAIEAARSLAATLRPPEVLAIDVFTYDEAIHFADRAAPATSLQAMFSLQHAVAIALLEDDVTEASFTPSAITDPAVARLRSTVRVHRDAVLTARYPAAWGARVRITTPDGSVFAETAHAKGDPELPMRDDEIAGKARAGLRRGGYSVRATEEVIDAAFALAGDGGSVPRLVRAMSAPR